MHKDLQDKYKLALQDLQEQTFWKAMKYRFDPVVGKVYADYLEMVNELLEAV